MLQRQGIYAGRKRVRRLMDEAGLVPVTRRKRINTTDSKHGLAVFPNLLNQRFPRQFHRRRPAYTHSLLGQEGPRHVAAMAADNDEKLMKKSCFLEEPIVN